MSFSPDGRPERPARPVRDELVMHSGGTWLAVRKGSLVLVPSRVDAKEGRAGTRQLFDLAADPGQLIDLAGKMPDAVNELTMLLEQLKRAGGSRAGRSPR